MRVIVAPDSFGDTLTAVQATQVIVDGWRRARPDDEVIGAPQSDGGPGFVDVLSSTGGEVRNARVSGPLTRSVDARWLLDPEDAHIGDADAAYIGDAEAAYIESAQACGLALLDGPPTRESSLLAHSRGVGELIAAALEAGATTIVVGLGGSCCTDGGRGLVDALGGLVSARDALRDVELVAATDVEHVLLGPRGAAAVFGPQKGADSSAVGILEQRNTKWLSELEKAGGTKVSTMPGAGAAGGIGAALFALGAVRRSGADVVAERTGQAELLKSADLVVTGEGKFDHQSLHGKLVTSVAAAGALYGVPTLVLAGQAELTEADYTSFGIVRAESVAAFAGSIEKAMTDARANLRGLAERTARDWNIWRTT
ncbi:glycerate kinase family protein [Rhodococcus sp. OK302]|uniref:glycerate kinase family protein n=1 Tax=Rhodococcus sp. OK302 TaxID=1882769 RepID=UPI000B93A408|nr:glycerate kinase [Rhodococcus sp. OK302]OYD70886.1 glycerate kinase [Rhodococcus sp. OK302]